MNKKPFSPEEQEQIAKLVALPEDRIDTTDIPEAAWADPERAHLYRPVKTPVTIRLDADVLNWFKEHAVGGGYQTEINRVLRRHVAEVERKRA